MMRFPYLTTILAATIVLLLFVGCDKDPVSPTVDDSEDPNETPSTVRLTIENPIFDFGYTPQYSIISHDFWLKSTGTDTLRILKINPG